MRRAIRYLRATVRAGRIAERVLEDLARDGHSRRRFAIFWPSRLGLSRKHPISDSLIGTLRPAPEVRRRDVPDLCDVRLELRATDLTVPASDGSKTPSVYCTIPSVKGKGARKGWGRRELHLGVCRLNSDPKRASFSFDWGPAFEQYRCGVVHRSKWAFSRKTFPTSLPLPADAVRNLCLLLSSVITGSPHDEGTDPAIVALHRSIPAWLEQDGLAERIWSEIQVLMEDHRTAMAVLTT